jgi:hypothetical protein
MAFIDKIKRNHRTILVVFGLSSLICFIYSIYVIRFTQSGKDQFWNLIPEFLVWLNGAFIVGDMVILSLFFFIASLVLFFVNDLRYTLLTYLVFLLVRSSGEVLYWLNYQFASTHPHPVRNQFLFITGELDEKNVYILYQLMNQVWMVVWIVLLVVLFRNWRKIGKKERIIQ